MFMVEHIIFLRVTMKKMGIDVTFVDPDISPEDLEKKFRPNTKVRIW